MYALGLQGLIQGKLTTDNWYFSPKRKFPLHILFSHFDEQKIPLTIQGPFDCVLDLFNISVDYLSPIFVK
jgi:hypothetical protein